MPLQWEHFLLHISGERIVPFLGYYYFTVQNVLLRSVNPETPSMAMTSPFTDFYFILFFSPPAQTVWYQILCAGGEGKAPSSDHLCPRQTFF